MTRVLPLAAAVLTCAAGGTEASRPPRLRLSARSPVLIGLAEGRRLWLAGAYQEPGRWLDAERARPSLGAGTQFRLLDAGGAVGSVAAGKRYEKDETGCHLFRLSRERRGPGALLALSGGASFPRSPRRQSLQNPVYQKAVAASLREAGLETASARLTQHLRVDLDGDGTEEVLLAAHSRASLGRDPRTSQGDYAFAGLRFLSKGRVRTLPLRRDTHAETWPHGAVSYRYAVLGCPDIDGDGRLEIVLHWSWHEGERIEILAFKQGEVRRLLTAECSV